MPPSDPKQGTPAPVLPATVPTVVTPEDRSQYIRTMAKDMARVNGTASPIQKIAVPEKPVTLAEPETPFFSKPEPAAPPPQESVALPSMEEAGTIVTNLPVEPSQPASTDLNREEILARLRAKLPDIKEAPAVPKASAWPTIPQPPQFEPVPEKPVERIPPVTREVPAPAPEQKPEALHTYKSDFADRIDDRAASAFSVLAAQQDAKREPANASLPSSTGSKKGLVLVLTGIVLVVLAAGGIYATYHFVTNMKRIPMAPLSVPSIVFADEYKELKGTGKDLMQALASAGQALVPGNVLVTYVTEPLTDTKGVLLAKPAPGGVLIRALGLLAPDILLRNIAEESTVGVIQAGTETRPFFALRVESYERTYSGALTWEPLMLQDLGSLYPLYPEEEVVTPVASSTATSSPVLALVPVHALSRFADAVVANRDVRVLRDSKGRSLILYGYTADKRTLLIVRDEAAFAALLPRLTNPE